MTENWERTIVAGEDAAEVVLHRRGEDPLVMAFRRNLKLAGSNRISMETEEAFSLRKEKEIRRKHKSDIPTEGQRFEEWGW